VLLSFEPREKVDSLEVQDYVTELRNRNYYLNALEEEVVRGRRLKQAVSVVKISIDNFRELESKLGENDRDEVLRTLASILVKGSRTTDQNCRTALNEMSLILPHCPKKGAALRAERIRRIVEGTSFLEKGINITVSLGVSEFPSLCDSSKGLDESATKALGFISEKGGNKNLFI